MKKIYLAIPYTGMEESSYNQSLDFTASMMKNKLLNVNIFSPILHSHPLAKKGLEGDWEFWKEIDLQFIDWCDEVWVFVPKEGMIMVEKSIGVQAEIKYAKENKKNVRYFNK